MNGKRKKDSVSKQSGIEEKQREKGRIKKE